MYQSIITQKGQTTIPKEIRKLLNLKPKDKLFYVVEGDRVIIKPLRGDILELKGIISPRKQPEDFNEVVEIAKEIVSKRIVEDH